MFGEKKVLAIIPARGGSKRLPQKNILDLNGKPLIAWTIESALESKYIDKVMVSTDNLEINKVSKEFGAEVPFIRPESLSTDHASSIDVIKHALSFYHNKFDYVVLLQPTSPLRLFSDIDSAFELITKEVKAVVSVCETEHSPLWSNTLDANLSMRNFIRDELKNKRSQDLPVYYRLNGAIYIAEVNYFYQNNGFFGENTKAYIMPQERSVDIDTELDFEWAQLLMKKRMN